jgi:transglutaminase-like putative cysteine protease
MVAAAFAALALSRELSPIVVVLTASGGLLSFFFEPARHRVLREKLWTTTWNVLLLVTFAWTVLDALRGEALHAGVRFLCFLLVNKLWNRRASRDYLQAYVISFLMLVAGAALSSDLTYAGCFLAYVVFATWTLTLFHLRREMEENYLLKHSDGAQSERVEVERILNSRRIVGASFLVGTSLVSLAIFIVATCVFFLIPRFGFGFFATQKRRGLATVGFSDRVDLGEYGLVKDNPQVVMRVELPGSTGAPAVPLRMRGVSFDRYANGHWSRSSIVSESLRRWGDLALAFVEPGRIRHRPRVTEEGVKHALDGALEQHVYLDPLDTPVVFGAPMPVAFELPKGAQGALSRIDFEGRGIGEAVAVEKHMEPGSGRTYTVERKSGLRYTVYSDVRQPPMGKLLSLPDVDLSERRELQPYLLVPEDLKKRILPKALEVTEPHKGPYAKAHALESWLAKNYRYTLELKRDERYEPIEDFLFVQRAGHCEYFASSMAVMLRAVGIPSRSVNGFLGGEWNGYGNYVAIRQGDAHSWVEAWIEGAGWLTFDPTPAGPPPVTTAGLIQSLRQVFDTIELAWFKYVIEYDLAKQADAVAAVRRLARGVATAGSITSFLSRYRTPLLLAAAGLLGLILALRRRPSAGPPMPRRAAAAQGAFARALRALEKRGFPRGAAETGRELAARLAQAGDPGAAPFGDLVELYYGVRFGGADVPAAQLERLAERVARPQV